MDKSKQDDKRCKFGVQCIDKSNEHMKEFTHPIEQKVKQARIQDNIRSAIYSVPAATEFIDEDGFSDDDEALSTAHSGDISSLSFQAPQQKITSVHLWNIAVTGSQAFFTLSSASIDGEIAAKGARRVHQVDSNTHALLAPHKAVRTKKAYEARRRGIPIIDEQEFKTIGKDGQQMFAWQAPTSN